MLTPIRPAIVQTPVQQPPPRIEPRPELPVRETAAAEPYIERGTERKLPWETGSVSPAAPPISAPPSPPPVVAAPPPPPPRPVTTHTVWTGTAGGSDGGNRESGQD